jgi:hypothetical protein
MAQSSTHHVEGRVIDTLGTTAISVSGLYPNPVSVAYTAPSGASSSVTRSFRQYTLQTAFNCPGITDVPPFTYNLLDRVTLPDGSYYQFSYEILGNGNTTGRVASVRLPTGGAISYSYSGGMVEFIALMDLYQHLLVSRLTAPGLTSYRRTWIPLEPMYKCTLQPSPILREIRLCTTSLRATLRLRDEYTLVLLRVRH